MAITLHDIHAAADTIAAQGGSPTLAAIRSALGGGSFTTISEAMKEWKTKHQALTVIAPLREAAPSAISDRLSAFGTEVWGIALELANARLQSEHEALEQVRKELEQSRQEAGDLADQVSAELDQAQALIKQQAADLDTARKEVTAKIVALDSEKAVRLAAERKSEIANAALGETHKQISALNLQIKELKAENKALDVAAKENYKRAVTAESALSAALERLADSKAELVDKNEQIKTAANKTATALAEKEEQLKVLTGKLEKTYLAAVAVANDTTVTTVG